MVFEARCNFGVRHCSEETCLVVRVICSLFTLCSHPTYPNETCPLLQLS
jgi:hypothetical protein